jgi:phosphoribosylformimino-5-aminoimidazole carboxamide ribotide isomerase
MRIIPVLDLLNGCVVRGVAGKREAYQPITSRLTDSQQPLEIARAIREEFHLVELYIADLDAILCRPPHLSIFPNLVNDGFELMIDAGLRCSQDAATVFEAGASRVVAGLESLAGPDEVEVLCREWGRERIVFSLDLCEGRPFVDATKSFALEPFAIARQAIEAGVFQLIVLDIARVGTSSGVTTLPLCAGIRKAFPEVQVITGGGVRGAEDVLRLRDQRIDGVLIASALHDGSLDRGALDAI